MRTLSVMNVEVKGHTRKKVEKKNHEHTKESENKKKIYLEKIKPG